MKCVIKLKDKMAKILKPRLLSLGSRYSQASVLSIFTEGIKHYASGTPSVLSKVEQIFNNTRLKGGNFVFNPEGMKMSASAASANVENTYQQLTKTAVDTFRSVDTRGLNKIFVTTEIPGCPPLGNLLDHPKVATFAGHGCFGSINLIEEANAYLRLNPTHAVGLYAVEIPSRVWHTQFPIELRRLIQIDIQHQKGQGPEVDIYKPIINNIVVAALVRDNAIFTKMVGARHVDYLAKPGWVVKDSAFQKIPEAASLVGTSMNIYGSKMFMSPLIAPTVGPKAKKLITDLSKKNCRHPSEINHLLLHPGGVKILEGVEKEFGIPLPLKYSKDSLEEYGNCLSTSVFDVIRRNFDDAQDYQDAIIYGVGPGMIHGAHYVTRH